MIHLPDPALDHLVTRAQLGSSSGVRAKWFAGCTLKGSVLFVPEREMAGFIERCFLAQLRSVVTDLEIRVGVAPDVHAKTTPPKPSSLWKKGKAPSQSDML